MGYTHYFPGLRATHGVVADARLIIAASDVAVFGPSGQGMPILSEDQGIRLNGSRAAGGSYETFHLRGTEVPRFAGMYDSCKTGRQPYDEVVTAILIAAAARLVGTGPSGLTSDGSWADWAAGMALFERAVRPLSGDEKLALELDMERMRPGLFHD